MAEQEGTSGAPPPPPTPQIGCLPHSTFTVENFSSPIVTLRVGPERTVLTAHKDILTKADFFAKCLVEGRFAEGTANEIECPEDEPADMVAALRFLYTGRVLDLSYHDVCGHPYWSDITRLIRLYAIADKYMIEGLCQEVLVVAEFHCSAAQLAWSHFEHMKKASLQGSRIWKVFIRVLSQRIRPGPVHVDFAKMLQEGLSSDAETAKELMQQMAADLVVSDEQAQQHQAAAMANAGWIMPVNDPGSAGNWI